MSNDDAGTIGLRFYLNMLDGVIHDKFNAKEECRITEIRENGCGVGFITLEMAISAGFIPCQHCIQHVGASSGRSPLESLKMLD